jgi:2'-5' RNA ligase
MEKKLKRIFIGIKIFPDFDKLSILKKEIEKIALGNFTKNENFHITLRFIGYIEEEKITDLKNILKEKNLIDKKIYLRKSIIFKGINILNKIDYNSHEKIPKLIFIKYVENENITQKYYNLVNETVNEFITKNNLNLKLNNQKFFPHITIFRIHKIIDKTEFKKIIEKYKFENFGEQKIIEINIFESKRDENGNLIYVKLY